MLSIHCFGCARVAQLLEPLTKTPQDEIKLEFKSYGRAPRSNSPSPSAEGDRSQKIGSDLWWSKKVMSKTPSTPLLENTQPDQENDHRSAVATQQGIDFGIDQGLEKTQTPSKLV
ncbi:hypothetical protein Y032_0015g2644 [Ancylostoma ceylanicum]|nr:hypothetical protein Y032_0015g2644 [Ancylostoma ceylanicum]